MSCCKVAGEDDGIERAGLMFMLLDVGGTFTEFGIPSWIAGVGIIVLGVTLGVLLLSGKGSELVFTILFDDTARFAPAPF